MIQLNDEILNQYIDGELNQAALIEVKELLKKSDDGRRRLAALQRVHGELGKIKIYETGADFTSLLMAKIRKNAISIKKDRYFVFSISTIFMIISLAIIGYVFTIAVGSSSSGSMSTNSIDYYINYFTNALETVRNILSAKNISIIGSIFSFGIIITGYIFFENLRHAKRRLSRLQ